MPQIYSAVFLIYAKWHEVEYLIVSASTPSRKKLRKYIEKEHMLWYSKRGSVYFEDYMEKIK